MKKLCMVSLLLLASFFLYAQTIKVAILDFENTSGNTAYDGLGKALSNMLITDLKNNISPKKVQFYERGQLNKILDEQNLQKSKAFDKKTAVDFGKLSGSDYVFVGSLFVLEGTCNISSRLVDVKTSQIVLTKDVSGKIEDWISLKSKLSEKIALNLGNPFVISSSSKEKSITLNSIIEYSAAIEDIEEAKFDNAIQRINTLEIIDEIDEAYLIDLENKIKKANYDYEIAIIINSLKDESFNCAIYETLLEHMRPTNIYIGNYSNPDRTNFYLENWNAFYKNKVLFVKSHEELQEFYLKNLKIFMDFTDAIIRYKKKLPCYNNENLEFKELCIYSLLMYIESIMFMDDLKNETYYMEYLLERYKYYYLKLLNANTSARFLKLIDFKATKKRYEENIAKRNYFRFLKTNLTSSYDSLFNLQINDSIANFSIYKDSIIIFRNANNKILLCLQKQQNYLCQFKNIDTLKLKGLPTESHFNLVFNFINSPKILLNDEYKQKIIEFFGNDNSDKFWLRRVSFIEEDQNPRIEANWVTFSSANLLFGKTYFTDSNLFLQSLDPKRVTSNFISKEEYKELKVYN